MKLNSTLPSSAQVDIELRALSPGAQAWLYVRDDELQRRRASAHQRGATARAARRAGAVKAVKDAAAAIAAPLQALPPEARAGYIEAQIDVKGPGHYGLRKTPSLGLIQSILDAEFLDQKT